MSSVIVVGAGLAGLNAACQISQSGTDVTVLEARARVGGRVWSTVLDTGDVAELGGEWINLRDRAVLDLASKLGIELLETGVDFAHRDPLGGPPITAESHGRLFAAVAAALEDGTEHGSLVQLLDRIDIEPSAMSVLRSRLAGSAGVDLDQVALSEVDGSFGVGSGSYLRCSGGNQRLAIELASRLTDVRLSSPVASVRGSLVGLADGTRLQADAVVVAVPLPLLWNLDLDPPLPVELRSLRMGAAAKVAIATATDPPLIARQSVEHPIWYWTGLGEGGRPRRVVTGFAGTRTSVDAALANWPGAVFSALPETGLVGDPIVVDWTTDPWARGCYSAVGPGQEPLLEFFTRPHGDIVFAGEHTNGTGTIDGAIRSGKAAAELVENLGLVSRQEPVDSPTPKPAGQATPVPPTPQ